MAPSKKATSASVDGDVSMTDATSAAPAQAQNDVVIEEEEECRIRVLPGSSETAASFEFKREDHTLGNALRYIIMKNPDVEFCGYSIPHPSEALMNVRIQTYEGTTATEALDKGLADLWDLCEVVSEKFTKALGQEKESSVESPMEE